MCGHCVSRSWVTWPMVSWPMSSNLSCQVKVYKAPNYRWWYCHAILSFASFHPLVEEKTLWQNMSVKNYLKVVTEVFNHIIKRILIKAQEIFFFFFFSLGLILLLSCSLFSLKSPLQKPACSILDSPLSLPQPTSKGRKQNSTPRFHFSCLIIQSR